MKTVKIKVSQKSGYPKALSQVFLYWKDEGVLSFINGIKGKKARKFTIKPITFIMVIFLVITTS